MELSFSKEERLCSRKQIEQLYAEGHRMMAFPYSVTWLISSECGVQSSELSECGSDTSDHHSSFFILHSSLFIPCQVLIVAPKRRFHHAVDRNRVKRLTRECWRHTKPQLYDFLAEHGISLTLSLVYIHNEIMPYEQLLRKMEKLVLQLQKEIENAQ